MADFSILSGFNKKASFKQIRFAGDVPLLESELNEMQQLQDEGRAELIRQEIPSGFIKISPIDFQSSLTKPNTVILKSDSVANVNGCIIIIPKGTEIKLEDCSTVDLRNDLVMLECFLSEVDYTKEIDAYGQEGLGGIDNYLLDQRVGQETTRRFQFKYRLRVVNNANFLDRFGEGLIGVKARGNSETETSLDYVPVREDRGLYVAGKGDKESKEQLKTVDGFSFAIPMFKIARRNITEYSVDNIYGGSVYENEKSVTARPDNLFSNIIYERDIVDLRHKVTLAGFEYEKLLTESFDKFMRGELQTSHKLTMDKIYLGVIKTPMDEFVQFCASLDGSLVAEVGGATTKEEGRNYRYLPSPIGLGFVGTEWDAQKTDTILKWTLPFTMKNYITADFFIQKTYNAITEDRTFDITNLTDKETSRKFLGMCISKDALCVYHTPQDGSKVLNEVIPALKLNKKKPFHVRVIYDYVGKTLKYYVNGIFKNQVEDVDLNLNVINSYNVGLGNYGYIISDFSISSVARNNDFKTLPKDFMSKYDSIAPAFNGQRKIYSEALTFQNTIGLANASGMGHTNGIKVEMQNAGTWTKGDKIFLTGKADEIVSGIIEKKYILARLKDRAINTSLIKVDAVNDLEVGDCIKLYNTATGLSTEEFEITEVDALSKLITLNKSVNIASDFMYYIVIETSTEASRPTVLYKNTSGKIAKVVGTWQNVGTNLATFILEDNADLTTQGIQINYGLVIPAGQGATSEVLYKTLCGEIKGEHLVNGTIAVMDDFKGKVRGQLGENPNVAYTCSGAEPKDPSDVSWTEDEQSGYIAYMSQGDSNERQVNSGATGERAQIKFVFNLLSMIESKYGTLKVVDKIEWLKANIDKIYIEWIGRALTSKNNIKCYLDVRNIASNTWDNKISNMSVCGSNTKILSSITNQESYIDNNGCISVIAYSDKAVENEVASVFTDYIKCEVELDYPTGYDVLVPKNPRRDGKQAGVVMVRRESKEIRTYFDSTKEDGLIVYGEIIPVYPVIENSEEFTILAEGGGFLVSDLASSVCHKQGKHHYLNPLHRVRNDIVDLFGDFGFGNVPFASDSKGVNIGAKVKFNSYGAMDYFTRQYGIPTIDKPLVGIARYLVLHEGELKMLVFSKYSNGGVLSVDNKGICMLVPLENRPLVRESEGTRRENVIPTAWRTPTGTVEGYLNEDGQFIATYQ